jgi:hypothetical protein
MKRCVYISVLVACCLLASLPALAQTETCPAGQCCAVQVCNTECFTSPNMRSCTFGTGTGQNSVIATFNCNAPEAGGCTVADAHSIRLTARKVNGNFSIGVTANEDTSGATNGRCESPGVPTGDNPADPIDCALVRFFGDPLFNPESPSPETVPLAIRYSHGNGVRYDVTDQFGLFPAPQPGPTTYEPGMTIKIAWTNLVSPPPGSVYSDRYIVVDDPDTDHPAHTDVTNCPEINLGNGNVFPYESTQPDDNQFVCDRTESFTAGGTAADPNVTGIGLTFNGFIAAFPFCSAKQDDVEGDGHEQGDDGHEGDFEFCQRSKEMKFEERDTGTKMRGRMDAVSVLGNQATITGAGTLGNGIPVHYTAVVLGNAPVIGANHFAINWITATGSVFQTSGALIDGFIVVHTP